MKVAVIGCGYWGKNLVRNFFDLGVLKTVCDQNEETLSAFTRQYPSVTGTKNVSDVFSDPEISAVAVSSPAISHYPITSEALIRGKDVFVEKPLSLNVEEGEKLIALADEHKRILMVDHILQYHPAVIKLKELIAGGSLGKIEYIYSNRLNLGKLRREENILWSFAPHDISVILSLVGEMPVDVRSFGEAYLQKGIYDTTITMLSFSGGLKAHIFVSWLHPYKEQKLIVVGSNNMAVFDDVDSDKLCLYPHEVRWKNGIPVASKAERQVVPIDSREPLGSACAHFIECVKTRKPPFTDGREGLRVLKVLHEAQISLESRGSTFADKKLQDKKYSVHETAFVEENVRIGEGTKIWHFSHILKNTSLGKDCKIGQNVSIGPDVVVGNNVKIQNNVSVYKGVILEDNTFCGPSCVFTNVINPRSHVVRMDEIRETRVREGASIGANATIVCGHTIGRYAFVGAGAVVTKDVPDFALVYGNPARQQGWMCACGAERLVFKKNLAACKTCKKKYKKKGQQVDFVQ